MNEADKFAEVIENSFNVWYEREVHYYIDEPLTPDQVKILCKTAWMNGVYTAINNKPKD